MTKKTCTFIGFNSNKLSACWDCEDKNGISLRNYLKGEIEKQVIEKNISYFICGVGSEVDMYIAETILEIKKRYPHPWKGRPYGKISHGGRDPTDRIALSFAGKGIL